MSECVFGIVRARGLARGGRSVVDEVCALLSDAAGVRFRASVTTSYQELAESLEGLLRTAHARGHDALPSPSRTGLRAPRRLT